MAEHAPRYRHVAEALVADGAVVYANDHRGHGRTAGSIEALGDFGEGGQAKMPQDMAILTRLARAENPGLPVILMGHSMGSLAAQAYALDYSDLIYGLALSGSTAADAFAEVRAKTGAAPNAAFEPARTPYDWLSRDEAMVNAYAADPYCGFAFRPGAARAPRTPGLPTWNGSDPEAMKSIRPDLPIYVFAGDKDPINGELAFLRLLIDRYRAAGLRDVTFDFYADGRHEMLNEINRDEVIANLEAWIHRVI
jgi:alpha-beta hydrolase superfamily lysophospholipase